MDPRLERQHGPRRALNPQPVLECSLGHDVTPSPCTGCGACCASFRVSFYWADATSHGLADDFYEALTPVMACMKGTHSKAPHCTALSGKIGQQVTCLVYEHRPSPCRELQAGDDKCRLARQRHGLPPLPHG